ncbi:Piwi-domain-containing protein [Aaosphaeria arxii CBS 175.79]|uniref:Piwi-domain-containing protein n=1 Tax=Aaosphaeria arxii CBS 175.79 TaxID=1450172 RepID=A0A6A5X759_9PLEO|nr:Piwi-domain-containing protein [Aaosphaeria arxii CBS 175.79]KAF2008657.1 Piwi-domain-containing protein [Aaosphaeria arxii CBS 175.79]
MATQGGRGRGFGRGGGGGGRGNFQPRGGGGGYYQSHGGGGGGRGFDKAVYSGSKGVIPPPDDKVTRNENTLLPPNGTTPLSLGGLSVRENFPRRPAFGTRGTPVTLWANYFELMPASTLVLYRYDIAIAPTVAGRKLSQVVSLLLETAEMRPFKLHVVTDFKAILISRTKLPEDELIIDIPYQAEGEDEPQQGAATYTVRLRLTNILSVSELLRYLTSTNIGAHYDNTPEVVQALNIFLNHYAKSAGNLATIGSSKSFSLNSGSQATNLGAGLTAIRGFFSSIRVASSRILVNVNVSHGAFYEHGPLVRLMESYLHENRNNKAALGKFLQKVRIRYTHLPPVKNRAGVVIVRPRTIFGLATPYDGRGSDHSPRVKAYGAGAEDVEFWLEGKSKATSSGSSGGKKGAKKGGGGDAAKSAAPGRYITVAKFFQEEHGMRLKRSDLPVVNTGTREKPVYLPPEVCEVLPGQNSKTKLGSGQTQRMIKFAVRKPVDNAKSIVQGGLVTVGLDPKTNILLREFGITASPELITVLGRVLNQPKILYKKNASAIPRAGSWNMMDIQFSATAQLEAWGTLLISMPGYSDVGIDSLKRPLTEFHIALNKVGIAAPPPSTPKQLVMNHADDPSLEQMIAMASQKLRVLLIILPDANAQLYNRIKFYGDVKYGVHTICMIASKLMKERGRDQYCANVALKLNLKLGGINQQVNPQNLSLIEEDKTMIVGIDVTHPSPGSSAKAPSVAGMVASIDKRLGQWPATLRVQTARQEHVADLTDMLKSRLQLWKTKGRHASFPENILIYRDGVSEGQYAKVIDEELPLLRAACKDLYPAPDQKRGLPRFSIVIAGKRHKTRFYPTKEADADKHSNPSSGTVVDRGVTEARNWDFFLQAHTALQGTARPCHYYIILDEILRERYKTVPPPYTNVADILEELTHSLCYLFGRATKAVSLCPPAYYADIVCERARCYMSDLFDSPPQSVAPSVAGASAAPSIADASAASSVADASATPPVPGASATPPVAGASAPSVAGATNQGGGQQVGHSRVQVHNRLKDTMFYI